MKVIFLIAGKGSRLNKLSKKTHKSLLKINNVPIIKRLVNQFHAFNIKSKDITFITGYKSQQIRKEFGIKYNYHYYYNYSNTNNLHTLINSHKILKLQDTIICFSDILITNNAISKIFDDRKSDITILGDLSEVRNGTMKIISNKKNLISIGKIPRKESSGNYVGIMRVPKKKMKTFKKFLINAKNKKKTNYFTEILNDLIQFKEKVKVIDIAPNYWIEVDNMVDLRKALKNKNKFNG